MLPTVAMEASTLDLSGALSNVVTAATTCLTFIQDNVLLMTVFAGGILTTLAFKFIGKAKRAAK